MTTPLREWERIEYVRDFNLTHEHLALLQRANISWTGEEWGTPGLSPKRPFGNDDIERDIAEIVDGPFLDALGDDMADAYAHSPENTPRWCRLLAEVGIALQIAVQTAAITGGGLQAGRYERTPGKPWRRAD